MVIVFGFVLYSRLYLVIYSPRIRQILLPMIAFLIVSINSIVLIFLFVFTYINESAVADKIGST